MGADLPLGRQAHCAIHRGQPGELEERPDEPVMMGGDLPEPACDNTANWNGDQFNR